MGFPITIIWVSPLSFYGTQEWFYNCIPFVNEFSLSKQNSGVLRRHIWGYTVCLCPTKGTPVLNELINYSPNRKFLVSSCIEFRKRTKTKSATTCELLESPFYENMYEFHKYEIFVPYI